MTSIRDTLRGLPSIVGTPPAPAPSIEASLDPAVTPGNPGDLLIQWLLEAIARGVPEPHAVTLATAGPEGPDARVLILKDVAPDATCSFATSRASAKGGQLLADDRCALSIYWSPLARGIRLRGAARPAPPEESAADFRSRGAGAKVMALAGRQSTPLASTAERDRGLASARRLLESAPDTVEPAWSLWRVRPDAIEFWQGDSQREHFRLQYTREGEAWGHRRLWA